MKKTFRNYFVIWAVLLVLFNVIAFLFGGTKDIEEFSASFWVGYVFITLSFVGQLICANVAFNAKNMQKMFYNLPLVTISWSGLITSFIVGGLCMLLAPLPYWVGVIACAIAFASVAIAVVKANIAIGAVTDVENNIKVKTFFIKMITSDADALMAYAKNDTVKAECKKVYEALRYSDPMGSEMLASVESQITVKFNAFANAVKADDVTAVSAVAEELLILIKDRNNKCKILK